MLSFYTRCHRPKRHTTQRGVIELSVDRTRATTSVDTPIVSGTTQEVDTINVL